MSIDFDSKDRLSILGRTTTRRGLLARASRLLLGTVGVVTASYSLGPLSPKIAGASHCTSLYLCGICGIPCSHCGNNIQCPSGSYQGSTAWWKCCGGFVYGYYDWCSTSGGWYCGTDCRNNCPQDTWCSGGGGTVYYCSLAINLGFAC